MRTLGASALVATALLAATAVAAPGRAHACSCAWPGVSAAVDREDLVVVGRVVFSEWPSADIPPPRSVKVTIEVERYLKGSGPEAIDVYDAASTCGVMQGSSPGERWLVLATLDDTGAYHTSLCDGTTRIDPPSAGFTDESDLAAYLREFETVFGIPGALAGPQALPPGGGGSYHTAAPGLWVIPLLMAASAAAGAAGLALLIRGRNTAA